MMQSSSAQPQVISHTVVVHSDLCGLSLFHKSNVWPIFHMHAITSVQDYHGNSFNLIGFLFVRDILIHTLLPSNVRKEKLTSSSGDTAAYVDMLLLTIKQYSQAHVNLCFMAQSVLSVFCTQTLYHQCIIDGQKNKTSHHLRLAAHTATPMNNGLIHLNNITVEVKNEIV